MAAAPEIDCVAPGLFVWHRYAPEVKVDLFSTAIVATAGAFLVDPVAIPPGELQAAIAPARVAGVVVTNENHARAAAAFAAEFVVPLYVHEAAQAALGWPPTEALRDGVDFAPGLAAIAIEGAAAGEVVLYSPAEGGSLIVGDALINMESYGFTFLPAKYCSNQKQMRKSLRKLLEYDFARIVFAHGLPVVHDAKRRLAELLEGTQG